MAQPKNFGFGEEEQLVRDSARRFLEANAGIEALRALAGRDPGEAYESEVPPARYDEKLWRRMVELGWPGLAVSPEAGGSGMGSVAQVALAEEVGRVALPSPLVATLLASRVLGAAGSETAAAWQRRIAAGESASLAVTNAEGSWESEAFDVGAVPAADGAVLQGVASFVQDARKADFFLVAAGTGTGVGLYAVPAQSPGLTILPDRILDLTRDQARVELRGVEVAGPGVVAAPGAGLEALRRAWPALITLVAADLCGAAEWQLQTTTEYARVRTQFDHPLGFFQAVKHPLVNMMLAVDRARSLVYYAACAIDTEPERAERCARMAKAAASDAADFCSGRSVQLHGGIGVTWESDVHLYFKRQKHNQFYLGDGPYHRARLADLIAA